jgi:NAD+ synthase (glutamine-hydrolysing)
MRRLRVALAQINTTVGDFEGNSARILDAARRAADLDADLVAFPELAITGYPPEDLLLRGPFLDDAAAALEALARDAAALPPLVVGCIEFDGVLYNAAAVVHGGAVVGWHRKHRLPNYGVFDEQRYFQPGHETPRFVVAGIEVAATVCEDIWYADGPARDAALAGAEVIVNINASPFHAGKTRERERMIATRATDNHVAIAYVNQVGGQDELVFDGNSLVIDARGELLARGASMREDLVVADIAVDEVRQVRLHESRLRRSRLAGEPAPALHLTAARVTSSQDGERAPLPATDLEPPDALAEIYDALVTGTRDYVHKTGFEDVHVALSGGLDSSLVAAVAVDALGAEHVRGVSLPSRYSSEGSIGDARDLADRLGIELVTMPIEPLHETALDTLAREFEGTREGTAEENLQSRLRGMLVMALSNKFGSLVLTTGNKSEYACGYATLYGDMVGGFAVIKDVPKTLAYELARHRNSRDPGSEVIPQAVIDKPPSAELRPGQLDTDSLPPYEVLDPIIEAYVEDDASFEAIVDRGFEPQTVRRIIELINRNEYKRRQSPPGVKITPRAFGRDRRYPLASRYRGH